MRLSTNAPRVQAVTAAPSPAARAAHREPRTAVRHTAVGGGATSRDATKARVAARRSALATAAAPAAPCQCAARPRATLSRRSARGMPKRRKLMPRSRPPPDRPQRVPSPPPSAAAPRPLPLPNQPRSPPMPPRPRNRKSRRPRARALKISTHKHPHAPRSGRPPLPLCRNSRPGIRIYLPV